MTEDRANVMFAVLADPSRRAVMRMLSEQGPRSATELSEALPITRQAVAKHLTSLAEAGLVAVAEVQGREKRYRLTPAPLADAAWWMASLGAEWDERLRRLRTHLRHGGPSGGS
ncbi:MAG TPA: winged helix-turn-helix domain-containing protein [Actinomycetota bacterium]|nr:winged helix-turn-helix domain-containing protein [Actinomycetota bacterium]